MISRSNSIYMVEVFRTNVKERFHADMLIEQIHKNFQGYKANFDLEDCDHILRVLSTMGFIDPLPLIHLLSKYGFHAEPLPDLFYPPVIAPITHTNLSAVRVIP